MIHYLRVPVLTRLFFWTLILDYSYLGNYQVYEGRKNKTNLNERERMPETAHILMLPKFLPLSLIQCYFTDEIISHSSDEIIKAVQSERVVIIAGDTGCGKSTQIPQYLMEAGYNRIGKILRESFLIYNSHTVSSKLK